MITPLAADRRSRVDPETFAEQEDRAAATPPRVFRVSAAFRHVSFRHFRLLT
jgi:hypothetical protein